MPNTIVTDLEKIASHTAYSKGFEVINLDMKSNSSFICIQVHIKHTDSLKDVSLNDCIQLSSPMNEAIENSKLISKPFNLEISSAGLSEFLTKERDFLTFKGFPVEVIFQDAKESKKQKGLLHERSKDHLLINIKGKINRIPRDDLISVRLITSSD